MASRKTEQNITSSGDVEAATRLGKAGANAEEKSATKPRTRTAKAKQAAVTFNVTIPDLPRGFKEKVYLVGTFHQTNADLADWDPRGLAMKKVDGNHWTVTLKGTENSVIEYKYALGSWEHVEKNEH